MEGMYHRWLAWENWGEEIISPSCMGSVLARACVVMTVKVY